MIITKTTTKTYEVKLFPEVWKTKHGDFIRIRKKYGMTTRQFEKCFCCEHQFEEDEIPIFIQVSEKGNMFACQECLKKEDAENAL